MTPLSLISSLFGFVTARRRPRTGNPKTVVAIVTDAVAPYHRGGKEQWYQQLAPRLNRYVDVHVYTMKWWRGPATVHHEGVPYHAISRYMPLYGKERRSIRQAIGFAMSCFRLARVDFDVLVADHMPYLQLFPLKLVALVRRRPLAVTWHEVWSLQQWRAYLGIGGSVAWCLERLATGLPDHIIATSAHTAERLTKQIRRVPVIVAAGGVDLDHARRTEPAGEAVDLVSVGRLLAHKRFDLLLDCVALLADRPQPITCRIIGDGPQRPALARQAQQLGIDHLVEFRRGVGDEELLPLVKAGRLFVFPSEREGFGIAALEAIACGIPVITTSAEHNHARHLVPRSAGGVVCEPTATALAAAVDSVLTRRPGRAPEAQSEEHWIREFDWGTLAANIAVSLNPAVSPDRLTADGDGHPVSDGHEHPLTNGDGDADARNAANGTLEPDTVIPPPARTRRAWPRARAIDLVASLVAVGVMFGLAHVRGVWVLQALELLLLLTVPGMLCLRALRVAPEAVRRFWPYVPCASLAVVMGAALVVDLLGPSLGFSRPLATAPVADSVAIACAALVVGAALHPAPSLVAYAPRTARIWSAWPLLLAVLSWIGAMRLTNGHGNAVAMVGIGITIAVLLIGVWRAPQWSVGQLAMLIFGASLALMWSFSLRGHYVYGFDIATEYQVFTGVLHAGRWYSSHANDPYGAMLSLTVLPSSLVALTGASPLLVFKAVYPFLFALFPAAVFLLATRVISRRFAYLGTLFIVVQNYLFQQLPAIARQELGLLFFVCLVAAMFDARLRRWSRGALIVLLGGGLVLSHYGTTYVAVALFAFAIVVELLRRLVTLRPAPGRTRQFSVALSAGRVGIAPFVAALVVTAGGAAIFDGAVTDSTQNLSQFFSDLRHQGLSVLPNSGGRNIVQAYLSGNTTASVSGEKFARLTRNAYAKRTYIHPLPQAFLPANRVLTATVPGQTVNSHVAVHALNTELVLVTQIAGVLAILGGLLLWLRRGAGDTARSIGLLAVATLVVLAAIRFSGTAALDYNQGRAFLQAMVPLSVCLGWMLERGSLRPWGRPVAAVSAVALGLVLLSTSGFRGPVLGGGSPANVASNGEDFERFYFTQPEFAAARWLTATARPTEIVQTDRYAYLRMVDATGRSKSLFPVLTPTALDRNAWIYADTANFVGGRARGEQGNDFALYVWPSFVNRYWNLVYSNGSAAVYSRPH
jgi:glycosyltransferase involved in cell wall biosynthesis